MIRESQADETGNHRLEALPPFFAIAIFGVIRADSEKPVEPFFLGSTKQQHMKDKADGVPNRKKDKADGVPNRGYRWCCAVDSPTISVLGFSPGRHEIKKNNIISTKFVFGPKLCPLFPKRAYNSEQRKYILDMSLYFGGRKGLSWDYQNLPSPVEPLCLSVAIEHRLAQGTALSMCNPER